MSPPGGPGRRARSRLAALALAAAGCVPAPDTAGGGETLCFAEPRLAAPPAEVHARVAAVTEALPEPDRAWIRALITHESAGIADAVSPTGCAGLLAIQSCDGCAPCCRPDPLDRTASWYDRCSHEAATGYGCGPEDPRFDPAFPLDFARRRIATVRGRVAAAGDGAFPAALAVSWNAGDGAVRRFPSGLRDAVTAVEHLDLRSARPYRAWPDEDRWNKLVEVYDYVRWLDALATHWGAPTGETSPAPTPSPAGPRCFSRVGDRYLAATRPTGRPRPLEIRRLRFGRYEPDRVELWSRPEASAGSR